METNSLHLQFFRCYN